MPNLLRNWRRQVEGRTGQPAADIFPGHGHLPSTDGELRRLRRAVETLATKPKVGNDLATEKKTAGASQP